MSIYLIRHAESTGNAGKLYQGRIDLPLTERGREQAGAVGRWLAQLGVDPVSIYCSPLHRAAETAELIAAQLQRSYELCHDSDVIEYHAGALEGLAEHEIAAQFPQFMTRALGERGCMADYGGESYEDVQARLSRFIARVNEQHRDDDVLVVAHGGSLYQLLKLWCGWPAPRHYFTHVGNCTVFKLSLREVSGHLGGELQFMVPLELIERGLGGTGRLALPEA